VIYVDKPALMPVTDPYFYGFNQALADYWRFKEWEREFDGFVAKGEAPNLMMVRFAHDHYRLVPAGVGWESTRSRPSLPITTTRWGC